MSLDLYSSRQLLYTLELELVATRTEEFSTCLASLVKLVCEASDECLSKSYWAVGAKDACLLVLAPVKPAKGYPLPQHVTATALVRIVCSSPHQVVSLAKLVTSTVSRIEACRGVGVKPLVGVYA